LKNTNAAALHNYNMQQEFVKGEEGLDYINLAPGEVVSSKINDKSLERDIKKKL